LTDSFKTPLLPEKLVSPLYCAEIVWGPKDRVLEDMLAKPLESDTGLPKVEPSRENCTLPEGTPEDPETGVTAAENVMFCPTMDGFAEELRTV
jgi:hypothetical protein